MIQDNISGILRRIAAVCQEIGRDPNGITLVGVTKYVDISKMNEAIESGLMHVGENKVQDALKKFSSLSDSDSKVTRHMIGHLQTNKVKHALEVFDLIQSVDSLKLAVAIQKQAEKFDRSINCLVQVNTAGEERKFGTAPSEVPLLIEEMIKLKNLNLLGLMTIAPLVDDKEMIRRCFRDLRHLGDKMNEQYTNAKNFEMKYLSMGMTDDFEIALEEGSNMVRIGRAIFK